MTRKEVLKVSGMHCSSCKMLIEDVLDELGVESEAAVDKGTVEVEYDESVPGIAGKIKKVIEHEGFKVNESG
jgi:copper chaperone CopZ